MKSIGKLLGLLLLGLLLIVVALGFALTHLFDPNDYKDEIRQIARDKANLELDLKGDIGWSLFPGWALSCTTPPWPAPPARTSPSPTCRCSASVRVLPLLRKEVQMSDIRVEGLNLTLVRDEKGHGNWEDIGRPAQATQAAPPTPPSRAPRAIPRPSSPTAPRHAR